MKHIVTTFDKAFENRIRLGIMSILMVNEWMDYNSLKEVLDVSDGNLASHIKHLEKKAYIEYKKQFVGRKPRTSYKATEKGKKAFEDHLDALERLINISKEG